MVFPEIAVQMIEDIPFSEAPERGEKGVFIAVPCQAVQDDIRAQMRDAVPDKGEVFLLFQGGVFACAIEVCKVAVGKNMQKLQLHALNGQAVEIINRPENGFSAFTGKSENDMHHNGNIAFCEGIDRLCEHAERIAAADEGGGRASAVCRPSSTQRFVFLFSSARRERTSAGRQSALVAMEMPSISGQARASSYFCRSFSTGA